MSKTSKNVHINNRHPRKVKGNIVNNERGEIKNIKVAVEVTV